MALMRDVPNRYTHYTQWFHFKMDYIMRLALNIIRLLKLQIMQLKTLQKFALDTNITK